MDNSEVSTALKDETFYKTFFNLEDIGLNFEIPLTGFVTGETWNGSLMPFFEFDEAMRGCTEIIDNSNKFYPSNNDNVSFQPETDTILFTQEGVTEYFKGVDIVVNDETKHVYPVGAGSWIWNEVKSLDYMYKKFAEIVIELKEEYNQYGVTEHASQLECEAERIEDVICEIEESLKNPSTLDSEARDMSAAKDAQGDYEPGQDNGKNER